MACRRAASRNDNIFVPIGSQGFFAEGGEKARFDQQPVEACASISAYFQAYRLTTDRFGLRRHGVPFAGFWEKTICRFHFTIPSPAAVETGFIQIGSTKTREQNRRFRS